MHSELQAWVYSQILKAAQKANWVGAIQISNGIPCDFQKKDFHLKGQRIVSSLLAD